MLVTYRTFSKFAIIAFRLILIACWENSSIGRAPVSKTVGWGFESLFSRHRNFTI